ncbi:hypothetical protein B7486_78955, partial [cyanobacterium TDX16]
RAARDELAERWGVAAELWSVTSWKKLRDEAISAERHGRLHPEQGDGRPLVARHLDGGAGPVVAVTDYQRSVPDQVARWVHREWVSLGTDGYGRSDTREALRRFFETDAAHVVVATLAGLQRAGAVEPALVTQALEHHGLDPDLPDPWRS